MEEMMERVKLEPSPSPAMSDVSSTSEPSIKVQMAAYTSVMKSTAKGMESNITLWQFLLELLLSNQHSNIIQWTSNEGEFKLVNAEEVARMWGLRKNKHNMNYDKLSRALRYYYDKNIIKKVMGQKFVYKFVSFPEIVKTENKIPFKAKMESLAQEYGYRAMPGFMAYKPIDIKPVNLPHPVPSVSPATTTLQVPVTNPWPVSTQPAYTSAAPYTSVLTVPVPQLITTTETARMPVSTSAPPVSSMAVSSSSSSSDQQSSTTASLGTSTTPTTTISRPKPNPLNLPTSCLPPNPIPSPNLNLKSAGLAPPGAIPAAFSAVHTPIMLTSPIPMSAQRTPMVPLHFWSSLSPVAALSPRPSATSATTFQFPSFMNGHMTLSPVTLPAFSAFENLQSPIFVSSPTKSIQVP